ncbi:MAG: hypothetical protein C5B59_15055 [Bacteroidetes bacterium]|nr:MAG: hypothetical protein C5B59_15055 [Bacteroidota bacterium]
MQLALQNGYRVSLLAFTLPGWSKSFETGYVEELGINDTTYLSSGRKPFFPWFLSSILEKASRLTHKFGLRSASVTAMALSKRAWLINRYLKKYKGRPDLIIAHNPPTFYPVAHFAKKNGIKYGIDVEDYHPGEGTDRNLHQYMISLMKMTFPDASYISFAAPLIQEQSVKLLKGHLPGENNLLTINNVFPSSNFSLHGKSGPKNNGKIQFVWFSQNIGPGRGLESLLPAMDHFARNVELTLIGNPVVDFIERWTQDRSYVHVVPPLQASELYGSLSSYDIGLALETISEENRKYCLANKIWAYFQSGLFILASNTPAQEKFLDEFKDHGLICENKEDAYSKAIEWIVGHIVDIRNQKNKRFEEARSTGWENERKKLDSKWRDVLAN